MRMARPVKVQTRPITSPSVRQKPAKQKAKNSPRGAGWGWLIVFILLLLATIPFAASYFGQQTREEVVPTPIIQPTSFPFTSLEAKVEPKVEPTAEPSAEPTVEPTVALTPIPIESWQAAVNLFLLTGLREQDALEAAQAIAQINHSWASEYAVITAQTLAAYHNLSVWELEKLDRFTKLANALNPSYQEKIRKEMNRLTQEALATQQAAQANNAPEPETPEKVEVNLVPPVAISLPGMGISPENFRLAYNSLRKIPTGSNWVVKSVEVIATFPFFNLSKIVFERDPTEPGNPRQTWFVGAFLGKVQVGDKVKGKWILEELFP